MNKKVIARLAAVLSGTMVLTIVAFMNQNPSANYNKEVAAIAAENETEVSVANNGVEAVMAGQETESTENGTEEAEPQEAAPEVNSEYANMAIAQVDDYVNVRAAASEESDILGKLYNKSAATVLGEENGWYQITSGSVTGYVKSEYVVVGDEELIKSVATRYATVTTTTLFVRSQPTTESEIIYMLPEGDDLVAIDESNPGWVKVSTEAGEGFVSSEFVDMSTVYVQAESKEEEAARLAKEEAARKQAAEAAAAAKNNSSKSSASNSSTSNSSASDSGSSDKGTSSSGNTTAPTSGNTSSNGQAVVNYASQFLGNPYVYGGTSLTNGADCSGFVMSVYAKFGISLPHSSSALRSVGYGVNYSDLQPGDIVCYSGHVGIYAGGGQIIHAANERKGIIYSSVNYTTILAIRRIF